MTSRVAMFVTLILAVVFLSATARCQLPDAPSSVRCEQAYLEIDGRVGYRSIPCKEVAQRWWTVKPVQKQDGFWSFRRSWQSPVLHPNKTSWAIFVLSHAAAFGALAAANHQKEPFGEESAALGAVTGMDFLFFKLFSPAMALPAPVYATIHYAKAR